MEKGNGRGSSNQRLGAAALVFGFFLASAGGLKAGPLEERPITGRGMVRQQGWDRLDQWQILREEALNLKSFGLHRESAGLLGQADQLMQKQKVSQRTILRNQLEMYHALIRVGDPEGEKKVLDFLSKWRSTLGLNSPEILYARHLQASCRIARADIAGAESLLGDVVEQRAKILGPGHPDTLASRINLAYLKMGHLVHEEAETQLTLVLAAEEANYGKDDPRTCATRTLLANCYLMQDTKRPQALQEYQAALAGIVKAYGPRHPKSFQAAFNVATTMFRMDNRERAEAEFKHLTKNIIAVAGADSPDTLIFRKGLADCLANRGLLTAAEMHYRDMLRILFRSANPDPVAVAHCQTALLKILNHSIPRDAYGNQVSDDLKKMRETLGPEHPATLNKLQEMGCWKRDHGHFNEAESDLRQLVSGRERALGTNDWMTWYARVSLAGVLRASGKSEQAASLLEEILSYMEKRAGPMYADTIEVHAELGKALDDMDRNQEALSIYRSVQAKYLQTVGANSKENIAIQMRIAALYSEMGRDAEAERIYSSLCDPALQILGPKHIVTSSLYTTYGWALLKARRSAEAEKLLRKGGGMVGLGQYDGAEYMFMRATLVLALLQQGKFREAAELSVETHRFVRLKRAQIGSMGVHISNIIALALLADGKNSEALNQVKFTNQLCFESKLFPNAQTSTRSRCVEALVLRYLNKTEEWQQLVSALEVQLPQIFAEGQPILLVPKMLAKEGKLPFHAIVHAIIFSENRAGVFDFEPTGESPLGFPAGVTVERRLELEEIYLTAQAHAALGEHMSAYEKFSEFILASEPSIKGDTVTLAEVYVRAAVEAVCAGREDLARETLAKAVLLTQPFHPDKARFVGEVTQQIPAHLARTGKLKEARVFAEMAVDASAKTLGEDSVCSSLARMTLLDCLLEEKSDEAGELLKKHAAILERSLGPTNLEVVEARMMLLRWHSSKKEFNDVHAVAHALREPMAKLFGPHSDEVLGIREAIVTALEGQGLTSMALSEYQEILDEWEKDLGADSVHTVFLRHRVALSYQRAKQLNRAIELHQRNSDILIKAGGERNVITVEIWLNLALSLITMNRHAEAVAPASKAVTYGSELLGKDHEMMKNAQILLNTAKAGGGTG